MEWISASTPPTTEDYYLITDGRPGVIPCEGYWSLAHGWEIDRDARQGGFREVTHWMPYPELPKERHNDWDRPLLLCDGVTVTNRIPGTPVEYIGQCDDKAYYFRARHQHWRMAIADTAAAAVSAETARAPMVYFCADGQYSDDAEAAGYMPLEQAEEIIRRCVKLWRAAQAEK